MNCKGECRQLLFGHVKKCCHSPGDVFFGMVSNAKSPGAIVIIQRIIIRLHGQVRQGCCNLSHKRNPVACTTQFMGKLHIGGLGEDGGRDPVLFKKLLCDSSDTETVL